MQLNFDAVAFDEYLRKQHEQPDYNIPLDEGWYVCQTDEVELTYNQFGEKYNVRLKILQDRRNIWISIPCGPDAQASSNSRLNQYYRAVGYNIVAPDHLLKVYLKIISKGDNQKNKATRFASVA